MPVSGFHNLSQQKSNRLSVFSEERKLKSMRLCTFLGCELIPAISATLESKYLEKAIGSIKALFWKKKAGQRPQFVYDCADSTTLLAGKGRDI